MSVLILSGNSPKTIASIRNFGRKGIYVTTSSDEKFAPAFFSKYSKKHFLYPSANKNPIQFIKTIIKVIKTDKHEVILPFNSPETYTIVKYKEKLIQFIKVPFHDYKAIMKAHNKEELSKIANELQIRIPKTHIIKKIEQLRKIADTIDYPVVIKLKEGVGSIGLSYALSKNELITKYKETIAKFNLKSNNYPLIQAYIPGISYGVSLLFNRGDLRAFFTHKRLRQYPITGGPSTLRESVRNPKMEKIAIELLRYLEWHGVAMVEFKVDKRDKTPVLIEVNPRFWGSLPLAIYSGVDFPFLLYKMAVEGDIEPVLNYKCGIKARWLLNDLRAIHALAKGSTDFTFLRELIRFKEQNLYYDTLSLEDPIPSIAFIFAGIRELWKTRREGN